MTSHENSNRIGMLARTYRGLLVRGCILAGAFLSVSGLAQAQFAVGPVWGGVWGNTVGTAESSFLNGAAAVINSEGVYNLYTAKAMSDYEDARAKYLMNRREATKNYFAGKELYNAQQVAKRDRNRERNEALRELQAVKSDVPSPLGPDAFNPETGKVAWPKALRDSQYASKRAEIERIFSQSTTSGSTQNAKKVETIARQMTSALKGNITKVKTNDYIEARKFLERLAITG